jgi:hypothetical protein
MPARSRSVKHIRWFQTAEDGFPPMADSLKLAPSNSAVIVLCHENSTPAELDESMRTVNLGKRRVFAGRRNLKSAED